MTCKKLTRQTPFQLVYGQEVVIPMEYIFSSLRIIVIIVMIDFDDVEETLLQLVQLDEECFFASFHQNIEKQRKKGWHDRHI